MKNLLYYFIYGAWYLLSLLPMWIHYILSDVLYIIVYYLLHYRIKIVRRNLEHSFPNKSKAEMRKIEKDFYQWFCDYLVETVKLMTISEKQLRKRMVFKGTETRDYEKIFKNMQQPAFVFDGRNLLDLNRLRTIGFEAYGIGKPRA